MIPTLLVVTGCLAGSTLLLRGMAGPLVRRAWPAAAVPVLAIGALVNAACLMLLAGLLALALAVWVPLVADVGRWSATALAQTVPVPWVVELLAAVIAVGFGVRTLWRVGSLARQLHRSDRLARRLRAGGARVVFIEDTPADAFAVAARRGCVVISRALFDELDPGERRVLVAHELSHLRRRHHLYVHAADLAAAANPLLGPVAGAVRMGVERWADEDAARGCGARIAAGRALARTALVQARLRRAAGAPAFGHAASVLCATAGGVPERARALLDEPRPRRWRLLGIVVAVLLVTGVLTAASLVQIHGGFENAETDCPGLTQPLS